MKVSVPGSRRAVLSIGAALLMSLAIAPGAGAFSFRRVPGSPYTVTGSPNTTVVADFNGDGREDLAVESSAYSAGQTHGYLTILLGSPGGGFTAASGSPIALGASSGVSEGLLAAQDFNGDGIPDLALADGASIVVLLGHGDGTFVSPPGLRSPEGGSASSLPTSTAAGDFNRDGRLDLATANSDGTVSILLGRGDGTFAPAPGSPASLGVPTGSHGSGCCSIATGDVNRDGALDFVASWADDNEQAHLSVLLGHGDGTFTPAPHSPIALGAAAVPGHVSVADLNLDGKPDVAVTEDPFGSVSVLLGSGDGTFTPASGSPITVPGTDFPQGGGVADFNSDGKPDLAFATAFPAGLWLALGDGTGGFSFAPGSPLAEVQPGLQPSLAAVGNFDGRLGVVVDLYTTGADNGEVDVLLAPLPSDPPAAALTASSTPALTGTTVKLDASASSDPLDRPLVDYRWDLGDGIFDHDTGANPSINWTYRRVGVYHARVLVTNAVGETAIAAVDVDVRPAPPAGPVGVSIDNGDYATNTPNVKLYVVWPAFASDALISNDGGFGAAGSTMQVPLTATIPWRLRSEGRERLPKIVYLRFPDTANPTQTFTDDIILDTRSPVIQSATAVPTGVAATAARGARRRFTIRLRATEPLSGISTAQFSASRSGGVRVVFSSPRRRGPRALARLVRVRMIRQPRYVRVRSTAGTWSRWRRIG